MKNCRQCGLVNPPSAEICDCGYSFETGIVGKSLLSPKELPLSKEWRLAALAFGLLTTAFFGWVGVLVAAIIIAVGSAMLSRERPKAVSDAIKFHGIGVLIAFAFYLMLYAAGIAGVALTMPSKDPARATMPLLDK